MLYVPYPFACCSQCGKELLPNRTNFYKHGANLTAACKKCVNERNRRYDEAHPEVIDRIKKTYLETHPDRRKQSAAKYRRTHRRECIDRVIRCQVANPNLTKLNAINNAKRRRALKLSADGTHTKQQEEQQLTRQKHKCYYCNAKIVA